MNAPYAAAPRHSDTASPAPDGFFLPANAGGYGSAPITGTMQSDVERRLCEWQRVLLIRDLNRAQRQHRETSSIRKALAAATLGALQ
jgi:hypothetical protein